MEIQMMNLKRLHDSMRSEIDEAIRRVVDASSFILGKEVEEFENEFARWLGVKHAVGVASCTDALTLSLLSAGVGRGDEVITSSLSAFPTAEAILRTGAKTIFVDIDARTFNLDPAKIESVLTQSTKAIVPVHLYGLPADLEPILKIAEEHGLKVIEDCAQAHGAKYKEQYVGTFGLAGCFSFFPSKNLGAMGDGGMIATNEDAIAKRARALRNHGEEGGRFHHRYVGYNSRLSGLQAAVLRVKLKRLPDHNRERQKIAEFYNRALSSTSLVLPRVSEEYPGEHVYHLYVVRTADSSKRDPLRKYLEERGVKTNVHYPSPLHKQPACAVDISLPVVEKTVNQIISIPLFPTMEKEEMEYVAGALQDRF